MTKIKTSGPGTARRGLREGGGTPTVTRQISMACTLEGHIRPSVRGLIGLSGMGIITH